MAPTEWIAGYRIRARKEIGRWKTDVGFLRSLFRYQGIALITERRRQHWPNIVSEKIDMNWLNAASDLATVTLALVGSGAYAWYQIELIIRRRRLETFLKGEVKGKRHKDDPGRRTVLFLASALRMTEGEILEAGFKSKKLKCVPGFDKETHRADTIFLSTTAKMPANFRNPCSIHAFISIP